VSAREQVSLSDSAARCAARDSIYEVSYQEFGIGADRIGTMGFSAGGRLAAVTATMFDGGEPDAPDRLIE